MGMNRDPAKRTIMGNELKLKKSFFSQTLNQILVQKILTKDLIDLDCQVGKEECLAPLL